MEGISCSATAQSLKDYRQFMSTVVYAWSYQTVLTNPSQQSSGYQLHFIGPRQEVQVLPFLSRISSRIVFWYRIFQSGMRANHILLTFNIEMLPVLKSFILYHKRKSTFVKNDYPRHFNKASITNLQHESQQKLFPRPRRLKDT